MGQSGCGAGSGTEGTGSSRERLRGEQGPAGQAVSLGGWRVGPSGAIRFPLVSGELGWEAQEFGRAVG